MSATATAVHPHTLTTHSNGSTKSTTRFARTPVSVIAAFAGLAGAAAVFLYATLAEALSVPLRVSGASIRPADFSGGVVTCTVAGAVLAIALAHWAKRPAQTFLRATVALTAVSLVFPMIASETALSTKLTLALAHVVAAAIVIPIITRRLSAVRSLASS